MTKRVRVRHNRPLRHIDSLYMMALLIKPLAPLAPA